MSTGIPLKTPMQAASKPAALPLSTLKSESSSNLVNVESPIVSPDSDRPLVYQDSDDDSLHSSDQENRINTSNLSAGNATSRPTTKKHGNFFRRNSSNTSIASDYMASTGGPTLLAIPTQTENPTSIFGPPSPAQVKRTSATNDSPSFHHLPRGDELPPGYPTDLHAVCAKVNSSADRLRATLLVAQGSPDISVVDEYGRLPIHLLGSNEFLISHFLRQAKTASFAKFNGIPHTELDDFALELVKSYPRGCITPDLDGQIPFTKCLRDWVTLASKGMLPEGDLDNDNSLNHLVAAEQRDVVSGRQHAVEGMERVVEDATASRQNQRGRPNDDTSMGSRSVWTNLTNLTIPSAFKSVYSTGLVNENGATTRALYRNPSMSSLEDAEQNEAHTHPRRSIRRLDSNRDQNDSPGMASPETRPTRFFSSDNRSLGSFSSAPDGASFDDVFPEKIRVPAVVEWNLKTLSAIVEYFESGEVRIRDQNEDGTVLGTWQAQQRSRERQATPDADTDVFTGDRNKSEWVAKTVVSAVSSIPSIMKTLLLLDDADPAKQRLFDLTIVKRMIYNPHTIGNWLVYMLEAVDRDVADRGVQFLELLSSDPETPDCYGGTTVKGLPNKGVPTAEQRLRLYKKVSRLDYLLPAVLALEDIDMMDRVAKTHLMRHIQDCELAQRPTLVMAFFDVWFHITILVSFTVATNYFLEGGEYGNRYLVTFYITLVCIIFRVAWKLAQMASMIKISCSAFVSNNFRAGDLLIDWLSIGMVLGGLLWMEFVIDDTGKSNGDAVDDRYIRGYLAVTIGMLWASLLRWFYVINWGVTTFIDLLRQVLRDCKIFFFVLTMTILAFANMFYIILYDKNGQCANGGLCNKKDVYLEVYSIVLGQFDLEDFTTSLSVILFVVFTVFVSMVLFYVLIAVVVEAHAKFTTARFSSARPEHGSRARLVYVAHLRAFRRMIQGEWTLMQYVAAVLFFAATGLIAVLFLREIRAHFNDFYGDLLLILIFAALVLFLLFGILAFVSHMTYFDLGDGVTSSSLWKKFTGFLRLIMSPFRALMLMVLGVPKEEKCAFKGNATPMPKMMDPQEIVDGWGGSAAHIHSDVKCMLDSSQDQTKAFVAEELHSMESRMRHSSERTKAHLLMEISSSQKRLEKMVSELQSVLNQVVYDPVDDGGEAKQFNQDYTVATAAAVDVSKFLRQNSGDANPGFKKNADRPPTGRSRSNESIQNIHHVRHDSAGSAVQSTMPQDWSVDGMEGYQY